MNNYSWFYNRLHLIFTFIFFLGTSSCNISDGGYSSGPLIDPSKPIPVALLVPQSVENMAAVSKSLENAARLAISDLGNIKIDLRVYDTAGSANIAAQVAQNAADEGAKIILGPLFYEAAQAAGRALADDGINVLSFSNNASIAGGNVFVLGNTFENTAKRMIEFAANQEKFRGIIVHPNNTEGELGKIALQNAAKESSLEIVATQSFEFSQEGVVNTVPLVRAAVEIEEADILFLTSPTAGALGLLVQMLPEAGVTSNTVQYAGLARWDIPVQNLALPGVQGGWFAIPEEKTAKDFSTRYKEVYGTAPHTLAGLAYDGIAAIGALVIAGKRDALTKSALIQPAGFEGIGGIFRFLRNGTNERGLAIAQVNNKQAEIIDPAPASFELRGF